MFASMDIIGVLLGWGEKLLGGFRHSAKADLRIADQARLLRRQLTASFADWPHGPKTDDELLRWAYNAARGFTVTEPAFQELVDLRPEASRGIRRVVGTARDDFYGAADLIGPAMRSKWIVKDGEASPAPFDGAPFRKAFAHFKRCITALDTVVAAKDAQ